MLGNLAESLHSLGRWDEAAEAAATPSASARAPSRAASHAICLRATSPSPAATCPRPPANWPPPAPHFGTHDPMPQHDLPLTCLAIGIAAAEGRLLDARAELAAPWTPASRPAPSATAGRCCSPPPPRRPTPAALPAAEAGRAAILDRIREAAKPSPPTSRLAGPRAWVRAELQRAEGRTPRTTGPRRSPPSNPWSAPTTSPGSAYRLAESLLAAGARRRARPRHGAAAPGPTPPPTTSAPARSPTPSTSLAQRARLTLTPAGRPALAARRPAPAPSASPRREQDVLRLVAVGRTNRQIAEELFISPKTASVHVSNILAKLGVSGRGEAAAVAHRLGLFDEPTAG